MSSSERTQVPLEQRVLGEEEEGELTQGFDYVKNHRGERATSSLASVLSTFRPTAL